MNREVIKHIGIGIIFVLSHVLLFQYLSIFGAIADPLLIYILWLSMKYERTKVLLFAAGLGLFQDSLFDLWGLYMFSKTLLIFISYNLISRNSENRLLLWQIFFFIWVAAFVHNGLFLTLSSFIQTYTTGFSPIIFLLVSSLYTALTGALLYVFKGK